LVARPSVFLAAAAVAFASTVSAQNAAPAQPCEIKVVERGSGWPVPLVQLRTTHNLSFVTDNAGVVAIDAPELLGRETWFTITSDGYEAPADGFGQRGVRLQMQPGGKQRVEVVGTGVAKRLGRITGAGLFAESQKLGRELNWSETGVMGCDSVQCAAYRGRTYWAWGDTARGNHPLGIFHMTSATSQLRPLASFEPPLRLRLDYFVDDHDRPRGMAEMPGEGPTWVSGYVVLPDANSRERLVGSYVKIKNQLDAYESGLCVWNDAHEKFEHSKTLWTKSEEASELPPAPRGHPAMFADEHGKEWVLFGDPLPTLRCAAAYEAWQDPAQWETLKPQESLAVAGGENDERVTLHSGSIAWNEYRRRWVTVFVESFGKPSAFGELWYAEADSPVGPWRPAVKVLSHANYTFYNPRLHQEFTPDKSPILLFEGTYTQSFADRPAPTPRYDYNQILYRLDLDDPRLAAAQEK
jgi:hypothetical protein